MSTKLMITADDLGYDRGTNDTIAALLDDELITATTLLTVAPDAGHAVELLAGLGVQPAVHVALTTDVGHRWAPLSSAPRLGGTDGVLPSSAADLTGVPGDVVRAELAAQWRWAVDHGLTPTRLDSHAGTLYGFTGPSFLDVALAFCAEAGAGLRLPRTLHPYPGRLPEPLAAQHAAAVAGADALAVPIPDSILTVPGTAREIGDYPTLRAAQLALIDDLGPGTHELLLHPSVDSPTLRASGPDWPKRVWEHQLLRDPLWQDALAASGVELVRHYPGPVGRRGLSG